jgi:hypothetical protein
MTELRVLHSLWERGLVRFNRRKRPTYSIATTRGREVMSVLLAKPVAARIEDPGERKVVGGFLRPNRRLILRRQRVAPLIGSPPDRKSQLFELVVDQSNPLSRELLPGKHARKISVTWIVG